MHDGEWYAEAIGSWGGALVGLLMLAGICYLLIYSVFPHPPPLKDVVHALTR